MKLHESVAIMTYILERYGELVSASLLHSPGCACSETGVSRSHVTCADVSQTMQRGTVVLIRCSARAGDGRLAPKMETNPEARAEYIMMMQFMEADVTEPAGA